MKKLKYITFLIILLTAIISCHKSEKLITEPELIQLIVNNNVQHINVINRKYALITIKKEIDNSKFKVKIQSFHEFEKKMINLQKEHNFNSSYTYKGQVSLMHYLLYVYILVIPLYIIVGTICLAITLKNEFKNSIDKIAWVIAIIFAPVVGIILFIVIGRKQIVTSRNNV